MENLLCTRILEYLLGFRSLCTCEMVCGGKVVIGFGYFVRSTSVAGECVWIVVDQCCRV